jgi:hypothetical protein
VLALLQQAAQQATSQVPGWLQITVAVLAAFQSAAIIGGIIAAYYRFIKEKPHTSRLKPTLSGVAATKDDITHLQVELSVENVGQVPVKIDREATGLRVSSRKTGDDSWTLHITESVFGHQEWVQPEETVIDQIWCEFPYEGEVAYKLEFFVIENENSGWLAVEVVNLLTRGNNVLGEQRSEG